MQVNFHISDIFEQKIVGVFQKFHGIELEHKQMS